MIDIFQETHWWKVITGGAGMEIDDHIVLVYDRVQQTDHVQQGLQADEFLKVYCTRTPFETESTWFTEILVNKYYIINQYTSHTRYNSDMV